MKRLVVLMFLLISFLSAETSDEEYALFKRTISPSMLWGEDGLILVPKANTMGRGHFYLSANAIDSGKIQGQEIFLTTATAMLSTSDDVELGYTRRVFMWDDGDYTNIKMDTYHLKARVFHLTDNYIPQLSIGVNLVSIAANDFSQEKDILYNPYVVLTINAPLFTDNAVLSLTACAENVVNEGERTEVMFSGGADLKLFKHLWLIGEIQGVDKDGQNGVINLAGKIKIGWFSIGAGLFNIAREEAEDASDEETANKHYWMGYASFEIPFDELFKGGEK
jgi:hypothetical protein